MTYDSNLKKNSVCNVESKRDYKYYCITNLSNAHNVNLTVEVRNTEKFDPPFRVFPFTSQFITWTQIEDVKEV